MTLFRNDSLSKFFMMWFEAEEVFPCHLLPDQNRPHDFFGMKRIIEEGRYFFATYVENPLIASLS